MKGAMEDALETLRVRQDAIDSFRRAVEDSFLKETDYGNVGLSKGGKTELRVTLEYSEWLEIVKMLGGIE